MVDHTVGLDQPSLGDRLSRPETALKDRVLDFWFGSAHSGGFPSPEVRGRWFTATPEFDEMVRACFGADVRAAVSGQRDRLRTSAQGQLALVLLLDQFTRNIFRGTPAAFSGDVRAAQCSLELVSTTIHLVLTPIERFFVYMPFEHAEDSSLQALGLRLFEGLARGAHGDERAFFLAGLRHAREHKSIIDMFGRFPSRNDVLGRKSTREELTFNAANTCGQRPAPGR
jgi:uncharacterized protein (DUF924 family)